MWCVDMHVVCSHACVIYIYVLSASVEIVDCHVQLMINLPFDVVVINYSYLSIMFLLPF